MTIQAFLLILLAIGALSMWLADPCRMRTHTYRQTTHRLPSGRVATEQNCTRCHLAVWTVAKS